MKIKILIALLLTLSLTAAKAKAKEKEIAVCTQGSTVSYFWNSLYAGIEKAGKEWGAKPVFYGSFDFQVKEMPRYIEEAIKNNPAGLIVSIPDADLVRKSIELAHAKKIPIVAVYSGETDFEELGIPHFVGIPAEATGLIVADRLLEAGMTHILIVLENEPDISSLLLLKGMRKKIEESGKKLTVLEVGAYSPATASATISSTMLMDETIDGVFSFTALTALSTILALEANETYGSTKFATFDFSPHVKEGILGKKILFAVSEQPFMEGYLAMSLLSAPPETDVRTFFKNLNQIGQHDFFPKGSLAYQSFQHPGAFLYTGPIFITEENVENYAENF